MSEYYVTPADIAIGTRARSTKINAIIASIEAGFDALPPTLTAYMAELVAARNGSDTLLIQITLIRTLIDALEAAAGPLASFLNGTFIEGPNISMTDNGDDTLIIDSDTLTDFFMMGF